MVLNGRNFFFLLWDTVWLHSPRTSSIHDPPVSVSWVLSCRYVPLFPAYGKFGGKIFLWIPEIAHKNKTSDPKPSASIYMGESRRTPGGQIKESKSPTEFIWHEQTVWERYLVSTGILTNVVQVSEQGSRRVPRGLAWNNVASIITFKSGSERRCMRETHFEDTLLGTKAKWVSQGRRTEKGREAWDRWERGHT